MFLSGIADEAGKSIATQIRSHQELGWDRIEIRNVDGVNLTTMPDDDFERVFAALGEAGIRVSCFASQLCNWARPITTDSQVDIDELRQAIPRMHRCGTTFIRCMSYPNAKDAPWNEDAWRDEVVRRMRELARIAADGGVVLVHENCDGWGGQGPKQTLQLLEAVGSDHLKLVFDTGNVVHHRQDGWDFYSQVRDHVVYVHIKDAKVEGDRVTTCYVGEGNGYVREILTDLAARGYNGGISIEPHLAAAVHLGKEATDEEAYRIYVEYGRRMRKLLDEVLAER